MTSSSSRATRTNCTLLFAVAAGSLLSCTQGARPAAEVSPTRAPSLAGQWTGVARQGETNIVRVVVVLDSSAAGWTGSLQAQQLGAAPIMAAAVIVSRDSVVMTLPASAGGLVLRGRRSAESQRIDAFANAGSDGAPVSLARAGSADAAALAAEIDAAAAARRSYEYADQKVVAPPHANPDSARLVTSDIALFWSVVDRSPPESLTVRLKREYLDRASVGVHDFIPGRIISAGDLAAVFTRRRAHYDSTRAASFAIARAEPEIRAAFKKLKALYPPAVFPDVYFVVGRLNSGGTSTDHGLLIGAEMYTNTDGLPAIVSHELIHFQQHYQTGTLLKQSFMEGTADFIGQMISGAQINGAAQTYGRAHEHELWQEFKTRLDDHSYTGWLYGKPPGERPADLGYFVGYRIAEAYYARAGDKSAALREIISPQNVSELLAKSGYNP